MKQKKIVQYLFCIVILIASFIKVSAASPSFSFYPSSGIIKDTKKGFIVDILIDSGSYELNKARAVIKFDPKVIQLKNASRNSSLFEKWPEEQSSTDNTKGVIMLTGITLDDTKVPFYTTDASPDVFARLEFDVIATTKQDFVLTFEYSGEDDELMSVLIENESTGNVLAVKPLSAKFSVTGEDIPKTGISMSAIGSIVGMLLILVGGYIRTSSGTLFRKQTGTIVLSE